MMDELTRAIGNMINKYPQKGFTAAELAQISGLPVPKLSGMLDSLVKSHMIKRESSASGMTYWALSADPTLIAQKRGPEREDKGSVASAGVAAALLTAALAALLAELGS
jgi:hypothetical protein